MPVKKEKSPPSVKPTISFSDFDKVDLRIGKVVTAERVRKSERLIRVEVDFGTLGFRTIFTGLALWYNAEDLLGKNFIFVVNLESRSMMGSESQGMILCGDDGEKAIILPVDEGAPVGIVVR